MPPGSGHVVDPRKCAKNPKTLELVQAIQAGNVYVNVHTIEFPSGEIRGQVF